MGGMMGIYQIIDQVNDIQKTIGRISSQIGYEIQHKLTDDEFDRYLLEMLDKYFENKRLRYIIVSQDLFSDPYWDILVELFHARLRCKNITVSAIATAGNMPQTTGLRYIESLLAMEYIYREKDDWDGRKVFVRISDKAFLLMKEYYVRILKMSDNHRLVTP
jgi:DNA-binding MarR family transcriptional regulator